MSPRLQEIFFELFEALPRQGPGNFECTRRALELCDGLPAAPRILDLGCGAGGQTLHLARLTEGSIVAIDSHAPLIERLKGTLEAESLAARVDAQVADMTALTLAPSSFDLIWSEGALYNVGVEAGLAICGALLRPGGYVAFTDAVWRSEDPPAEVRAAFAEYPGMGTTDEILAALARGGWSLVGHFDLPRAAWWDDFYAPMERRIEALRGQYAGDPEAIAALDELAREPQMHREHGAHYGYTFFVARRGGHASRDEAP